MVEWFEDEGLVSDSAPVVAVGANAGDPHYLPTAEQRRGRSRPTRCCCSTSGANSRSRARCLLTSRGSGSPARGCRTRRRARSTPIADARDAAVALVEEAARDGRDLRGWEVDRAARAVLERAGYGDHILHRTGHSLGESVHGNGVHLDDYETHDDRRMLPGTGFTVEPGLYFDDFGVRTEINVFRGERDAVVTGPRQTARRDSDVRHPRQVVAISST